MAQPLRLAVCLALALTLASCGNSSGGGFLGAGLDQTHDPAGGPTTTFSIFGANQAAQTFTVGVTGTLTFLEVFIEQSIAGADITVDVRPTTGGAPVELDGLALATVTIPSGTVGSIPGWFTIDLGAAAIPVTLGLELAITLRAVGGAGQYEASADNPGAYTGGDAWTRDTSGFPGTWTRVTGADLLFRTYVIPTP